MKDFLIASIAILLLGGCAHSKPLMSFQELNECVDLDHRITLTQKDLDTMNKQITESQEAATAIGQRAKDMLRDLAALKSAGKIDEHNALAARYNWIKDEHKAIKVSIEEQTVQHNETLNTYKDMSEAFKSMCQDKRIFKPDLKKACAKEPAASTSFCTGNPRK